MTQALIQTAHALLAGHKGLLAMDESNATCNQRFASAGIAQTVDMRRAWRELLLTTPGLGKCISGVILFDETIHQTTADGTPFTQVARDAGLLVGIKVDTGAKPLAGHPGETVTEGLDGLRERLHSYAALGARFAKWRGVLAVDKAQSTTSITSSTSSPGSPTSSGTPTGNGNTLRPTPGCMAANAHALARYAALCQEAGLVPIIEPEVLMDGTHTLARCQAVTEAVLRSVFAQLALQGVVLEAVIVKPNMVVAGLSCATQPSDDDVAAATLQCLLRVVPAAVAGVAFLSGGQTEQLASSRLNAMHTQRGNTTLPWALSFSFARALQQPALAIWAGQQANTAAAQQALLHRACCNWAALQGTYSAAMETPS